MIKDTSKHSVALLLAVGIGVIALIYTWNYINQTWGMAANADNHSATALGQMLGMALVLPHQIVASMALVFSFLGLLLNARWGALVGGILYAVAMVLMIIWFYFVIAQLILCFIAYATMNNPSVKSETVFIPVNQPEKAGQAKPEPTRPTVEHLPAFVFVRGRFGLVVPIVRD